MNAELINSRLRRFLLGLATFILLGTIVELLLEDHYEEVLQLIPFVLCGLGVITLIAAQLRPQRTTFLALRVVMVLNAVGGGLGFVLHLVRNYIFEQEIRPNAEFADLLVKTLKGANPLFAPGILAFAALIALAATYYHPALREGSDA